MRRAQIMLRVHRVNEFSPQAISGDRPRSFFSTSPSAQSMILFDGLSRNTVSCSSQPPLTGDDIPVDVTPPLSSPFRTFSRPFLLLDRTRFGYSGLPDGPLKLSVRRLDGSSFDIEVERSATVANVRQAIQDVFSNLRNNNCGEISWTHVWGHFCLCYNAQKLIKETDSILNYGIKDGDQIHFAQHLTIADTLERSQSKKKAINWSKRAHAVNRKRSRVGYELISMQDDDLGDIEEGRWK